MCYRDLSSAIAWSGTHPDLREISAKDVCLEWCRYSARRTINMKHPFADIATRERKIDEWVSEHSGVYTRPRKINMAIERAMYTRQEELMRLMSMVRLMDYSPGVEDLPFPIKDVLRMCRRMDRIIGLFRHTLIMFRMYEVGEICHDIPGLFNFFIQQERLMHEWKLRVENLDQCPFKRAIHDRQGGF